MAAVGGAQFQPIPGVLVAAAMRSKKPDRALLERARAGREAITLGADPALTLALIVWPNEKVTAAQSAAYTGM